MIKLTMESWLSCWLALGATESAELRALHTDVIARYSEEHRHYHTTQHLAECFQQVSQIIHLAQNPNEILIGLWFHDAIYDTQRPDNEERSAAWAQSAALSFGLSSEVAQRIRELIMATRHATEPAGIDAQVLVDADLAILSASPERFRAYERQVRNEYSWVSEVAFRAGRAKILEEFVARRYIYCTQEFRDHYEQRARVNLSTSLAELSR